MNSSNNEVKNIQKQLIDLIATQQQIEAGTIDIRERFTQYGLNSLSSLSLLSTLAQSLGRPIAPTVMWEHPTIELLARHLGGQLPSPSPRPLPPPSLGSPRLAEPIAIVGLAGRFPGARNVEELWRNLCAGVNAIQPVPEERWDIEALYDTDLNAPGKMNTRWGGFIDQVDQFDPAFFGISPREAVAMDPQQRLVLEEVWTALEDAGIPAADLKGSRTSVYVGCAWTDYSHLVPGGQYLTRYSATGQDASIISARVSYTFGLQGPSLTVYTACSSSLVTVHLACQSLRTGEAVIALAAGVNLMLAPESTIAMTKFGGMSPDGQCKSFAAGANGYVRGEGCGVLVLKRLSDAIAAGDSIYCVIRGSAVNNDGFSNGLSAPSRQAQEILLEDAYHQANLAPGQVHYVEAHGTGTALGDPIEANALGTVLSRDRAADRPLRVGSIKTNIGHLESAAGVAGVIKVALAIKHRKLPPSLNFEQPNPLIDFDGLHLKVQQTLEDWPYPEEPALAGVSAFGFGGTNCHVVLQELPSERAQLLPLAAETPEALISLAQRLKVAATGPGEMASLPDLCATAAAQFSQSPYRLGTVVRSRTDLLTYLDRVIRGKVSPALLPATSTPTQKLVFVFSGQGAQWTGMGLTLLRTEPVFRSTLEQCDRIFQDYATWSIVAELCAEPAHSRLDLVEVMWPVTFAIQVSLTALWRSWGIEPDAVLGYSMGEVAAAHCAGVLDLETAIRVIYTQSRAIGRTSGQGDMALVSLSWTDAEQALADYTGRLYPSISYSPVSTVISGEPRAQAEFLQRLQTQGIPTYAVKASVAGHSPLLDSTREEVLEALSDIEPQPARVPLISPGTATVLETQAYGSAYWASNLCVPVYFSQSVIYALQAGYEQFLEINTHAIVAPGIKQTLKSLHHSRKVLASMRQGEDEHTVLLASLADLYLSGRSIDWSCIYPGTRPIHLEDTQPTEFPDWPAPKNTRRSMHLLTLSAHSQPALRDLAKATQNLIEQPQHLALQDLCFAASLRRDHHDHRLALVGSTRRELVEQLDAFGRGIKTPAMASGRKLPDAQADLVLVFSGQGNQWVGMGRELLGESVFRNVLDECDRALRPYAEWSIWEELTAPEVKARLEQTQIAQPVLFSLQIALVALWKSWGLRPTVVIGHSVGEIAAAYTAGALSLADAMRLAYHRGLVMQQATGHGAMAAVDCEIEIAQQVVAAYPQSLSIAAINSPTSIVLSGEPTALEQALHQLQQQGVSARSLGVNYAFHSYQMEALRHELVNVLEPLALQPAILPMYSTVTGRPITDQTLEAEYWGRNIRQPVQFAAAIQQLLKEGHTTFLEIGPGPVLARPLAECASVAQREVTILASLRRQAEAWPVLLKSLGQLYTQGHTIEWAKLYPQGGQRVRFPTYPWQRERFWITDGIPAADVMPSQPRHSVRPSDAPALDDWLYDVSWQPAPLPTSTTLSSTNIGRWLIFADQAGYGEQLAQFLHTRHAANCILVTPGERYAALGPQQFQVNPTNPQDFQQLIADTCPPNASPCSGIVHLWSLDAEATSVESLDLAQAHGCLSSLHILQAVLNTQTAELPRLWLVTRGVHRPDDSLGPVSVAQAPLWGLGRTIMHEHPELHCTLIDLGSPETSTEVEALYNEICANRSEDQIVWRRSTRYIAQLAHAPASAAARPKESSIEFKPFRPDGTYLITGGLGGLGLAIAQHLVRHGAQHLVLMSRRGPNAAAEETIRNLQEQGAHIRIAQADVARPSQIEPAFADMAQHMPPLRGVIHAAGVMDGSPMLQLDRQRLSNVLAPKVQGAWNLHRLTLGTKLDYFVLFSSVSSLLGYPGHGNYAAANAFLDALAHERQRQGLPVRCINWGPWAEIGLVATSAKTGTTLAFRGLEPFSPEQGLRAFQSLLERDTTQMAVMRFNLAEWCDLYPRARQDTFLKPLSQAQPSKIDPFVAESKDFQAKLFAAEPTQKLVILEKLVGEQLAQVLGLPADRLDRHQPFRLLGMDSLMSIEVCNRLQKSLGLTLSATLTWNYPTLTALVPYLANRLGIALKTESQSPEISPTDPIDHEAYLAETQLLTNSDVDALLKALE